MSTFPPPVPKPSSAGSAKTAIVNTKEAYANIRNGPGTQYRDIGDLRNHTLANYYPGSRNGDWLWIEQYGVSGWVSTTVASFEDVSGVGAQPGQVATPYDGKIGVWHWRGDSVGENNVEELAQTLTTYAPHIKQVWVKTSDYTRTTGAQWMGYWDSKRTLAIDGPGSIDQWVNTLARYGLEFHAWCVPRGADIDAEANLIIQACSRPGVRSMILDVEPYDGFWLGGRDAIRPLMSRIRRSLPGSFHIGMAVDPRIQHYEKIYPAEWFPFINSIHPMVYWPTFREPPDESLQEAFNVWKGYGRPIIPILQGDANTEEMREAHLLATQRHGARGLSWWRFGVMGPAELQAASQPIVIGDTPPVPSDPPPTQNYTDEQVVRPQDPSFSIWSYTGQQEVQSFQGTWGWQVYYKATEAQISRVAARWSPPQIKQSGQHEIAAFIPQRHATTRNARYKIHGVRGANAELLVSIDQSKHRNEWVTLGVFDIDKNAINAGTVFLNDLTGESGRQIAFDAIRWRRIITPPVNPNLADGYDSPVGTREEREGEKVWPGRWLDASPFGRLYFIGTPSEAYHTGADLNLPSDADAHMPVYSAASGVVIFAARLPVWGNVIIVKHDPLSENGRHMYGRYAHVENMMVKVGQRVARGQQIARVGNAFGAFAYHLHFDLSPTTVLESKPEHWPGKNRNALFSNYIDPREFIASNRPRR